MKVRQWEIWKCKPEGFERDHWFVIVSNQERCESERLLMVNGLACFSLRGEARGTEIRLNGADGFEAATVCQCDFFYPLAKTKLHSRLGSVSWERQLQIKSRVREVLRL
jgi:hypothetical protein